MSSELFALLSHRTLPSEHHLNVNSSCPNMDLAVFTCPSAATVASTPITSTEVPRPKSASFDTLTCYRLGNSTPTVWSVVVNQFFTGSMPCCDPSGRHVQVDPAARFDQITALHWSPDGQCLAVALGSSSATRPPALILLSVHDGQLLVPPTIIPDQSTSTEHSRSSIKTQDRSIHFAAWLPLDSPDNSSHSPEAETWQPKSAGQSLCDSLPANLTVRPMLDLEMLNNDIGAMSTSDAAGKANSSSAFRFPPSLFKGNQSLSKTGVNSLLILSSHRDQIHFFINGTVYLGSTTLPGSAQLRSVRLMALDSSHVSPETLALPPKHLGSIRLQLFWLTLDGSIGYGYLDLRSVCITRVVPGNLPLPIDSPFFSKPTLAVLGVRSKELDEQIRLSHSIHGLLRDCLFGYFSIIKEWSMCRSGAQKWYDSFDEISKAHGVLAPLSFQMLQLLFLGQASEGLRDFLGTKTAERVFSKWEFTSTGSVRKIRCTIVELLVPNLERLFVLVTELRNRVYPDITQPKLIEDSNFEDLLLVEELIKQLLFSVHDLDHKLEREEYAYKEFCKWLRSEFEFIISVETAVGPFNRPPITYDFMTVSQFIQRGNTNEVDQLISSHETCDVDQHLALQLRNHHLIQGYYEDLFDTNGPQKREKTRETLDALLDQIGNHEPQSLNSEVPPVSQPKIGTTLPIHATPDTSHFQMNPNQDFHTPGVLAHLSKRDEASLTPSNVLPHCLRRKTVPSEASPPDSKTTHIDEALGIQGETRNSRGIYANLVSCSSYLSNVMISIFERIGSNQTVEVYESQNKADLSDTPKNLLCSHYVDSCQYFAYLGTNDQIVVRRIRVDISPDQSQTFKDTQASVMCRITGKGDKTLEPVIVLDLAFFDDVELVVLGQLGIATRYVLLTIRYSQLFDEATNVMEYLPVYRLHQLQSEYSPEQISLNGNKGRRTGCVISGKGRVLHVFDMEDEGGSEDLEMEKDDE